MQAANGLFSSFAKLRGSSGNEDFFSFDESPLHRRPQSKSSPGKVAGEEKERKKKQETGETAVDEAGFGFTNMMDSSPDIWSLFNGEWGNKIEGERRRRRRRRRR